MVGVQLITTAGGGGGAIVTESVAGLALKVALASVCTEKLAVFDTVPIAVGATLTGIVIVDSALLAGTVVDCVLQETIGPLEAQVHPIPVAVPLSAKAGSKVSVTVYTPVMGTELTF